MKPPIGFVLVTHSHAEQTLFLCERLSEIFGDPPIAIHHDFSQSPLNKASFPKNIHFVEKWVPTSWGNISVVDALLSALRLLYTTGDPDWVTSLSASDYPIKTAGRILSDLRSTKFDGFLDSRRIQDPGTPFVNEGLGELSFKHPRYHQFAFNRYVAIPLMTPRMAKRLRTPVEKWCLRSKFLTSRFTPFHDSFECYGGDAWFTVNRRAASRLLDETPAWQTLKEHYKARSVPEESFYHTLLGNAPGFNLSPENLRYTDWKGCYAHPRTLGREDFPRLLASNDHFARKFPFDPNLLRELDDAVASKERDDSRIAQ